MAVNYYNNSLLSPWNPIDPQEQRFPLSRNQAFQQFDKRNWILPGPSLPTHITYPDNERSLQRAFKKGLRDVLSHVPNIILMGASTLLFPLLPKPFKMSFKHSLYMAPVHMAFMALINFGLGVYRSMSLRQDIMPLKHH